MIISRYDGMLELAISQMPIFLTLSFYVFAIVTIAFNIFAIVRAGIQQNDDEIEVAVYYPTLIAVILMAAMAKTLY